MSKSRRRSRGQDAKHHAKKSKPVASGNQHGPYLSSGSADVAIERLRRSGLKAKMGDAGFIVWERV
jgi:hypothetical protein